MTVIPIAQALWQLSPKAPALQDDQFAGVRRSIGDSSHNMAEVIAKICRAHRHLRRLSGHVAHRY
jgi:hypothetical protein